MTARDALRYAAELGRANTVDEPEVYDARDPDGLEAEADAEDLRAGFGPSTILRWRRELAWARRQADVTEREVERVREDLARYDAEGTPAIDRRYTPAQLERLERRLATWRILASEYGRYVDSKPAVTLTAAEVARAEDLDGIDALF